MKKLFVMLAALLAIALPKTAQAIDVEGMYVGGLAGFNFLCVDGQKHHHHHKDRYKVGWIAGADVGYRMCNGIRAEAEVSFRSNKHRHAHRPVQTWSFMANGYYEIDLDSCGCSCWGINPFIGGGVGYDWTKHKTCRDFLVELESEHRHRRKDHKNGFAWQLMTGVLWDIDDCMEVVIEYRFHKGHIKHHYNHTVDFGVHWFF